MKLKIQLIVMNFLQFAVWGAYLTSMGSYLAGAGQGANIGIFYAMQGITSLFMPALICVLADRWIPAQKMLGICHLITATFILAMGYYGMTAGENARFGVLLALFSVSIGFYMPSLALSYSVAYSILEKNGLDTVKAFPPVRTMGTVGFICTMLLVDWLGFQTDYRQFFVSGALGLVLAAYTLTLPACAVNRERKSQSVVDVLGLRAFSLMKDKTMALFFLFSMLLGVCLQITNSYANPFITSFKSVAEFADTFGANHANALISLSQCSETLCILLIPFFMKRFGIKRVMLLSMLAWTLRFGLFATGNPGSGVWMFILSMVVYGMAFDFFNVSGSLFVNGNTDKQMRSSAQGLLIIMTNGIGGTLGMFGAQVVVNHYVANVDGSMIGQWSTVWYIFAAYSLLLALLFAVFFKYKYVRKDAPAKAGA